VFFVLDEGAISEDLTDADLPKLLHEDSQVVDEQTPPNDIPVGIVGVWPHDEQRLAKLVDSELIVGRRQQAVARECR